MKRTFRNSLLSVAACLLTSASAFAQTAALGSIAGIVRDNSGAIVPNATVTVTNLGTGAKRTLATDGQGHYEATFLQPGNYEVVLGGGTFGTIDRKGVMVNVGSPTTVDATLPAASVNTEVVVSSEAPLVDTDKVDSSQVVDQKLVANLPVNGRRFDNFVLLTPNVVPDGNSGLLSYRGISGIYNSNLVDGANNNQAFFSEARGRSIGAPYVFPIDAIQEFSSQSAGYSAEFGQAAGGIINAVTKSGSNQFHGVVYEYFRTPGWNALDPYSKYKKLFSQPVKEQHQFGVSMGGPIIKDKLFFHFTYDGYRKVTPITYATTYNGGIAALANLCNGQTVAGNTSYPSTIPGISATQCSQAVSYLESQMGVFGRNVEQNIFLPRLDYQVTPKTHLSASFLWENFGQPNGYNTSTSVNNGGISQNGAASFHQRYLIANAETALTDRSANVVHFQWARDLETASTNSGGPAMSLTGIAAYGETSALPRGAFPDEHRWQITDIYSATIGKHSIKAGFDLNLIHEQLQNLFQGNGQFSYATGVNEGNFANWIQDVFQANGGRHYNSFTQVNDPITHVGADDFWNQDVAGFVEDSWKATPKLLISAGIRYDVQLVPQPDLPNNTSPVASLYTTTINNYKAMVQPRVGFNWNPQNGTVLRGGFGIFYGLNSNSTYYTMRRENGVYQQQYNVSALTNPNAVYVAAGSKLSSGVTCAPTDGSGFCFQQAGTYATNAPQGGVPEFTPPGPAPVNPVTGAANPAVSTGLALSTISARGLDPNFKNPESMSFDLTLEQELPGHMSLTLAYVGNLARRLPIFVDTNVDPSSATTRNYYYYSSATASPTVIPIPFYNSRLYNTTGAVLTGFSDVNANYHSGVATVKKPFSHGIQVLANYTWSKAMDGGQVSGVNGTFNGTDTPIDPFAKGKRAGRAAEYARSDMDVRSRFVASFVAQSSIDRFTPNRYARYVFDGFQLAGSYTLQSGMPITGFMSAAPTSPITDGGLSGAELSLYNSGTPGRVPTQIAPRNAFSGYGLNNFDARISRMFPIHNQVQLELFAEAFNLVNHDLRLGLSTSSNTYIDAGKSLTTASGLVSCPTSATGGCIVPLSSTATPFMAVTSTSSVLYGPRQVQITAKLHF
ncbi:MAG: carboxypeptidase regulatory-like domain-containing protein [Acidobacteriaceae bacterium]|nr:carboxypeptidase regulatory-like domain-containing protein [Acidobacteriaceae bacterium]